MLIHKKYLIDYPEEYILHKHFIDIDYDIIATILILNKKGYQTSYCCSGHLMSSNEIYILNPTDEFVNLKIPKSFIASICEDNIRSIIRHKRQDKHIIKSAIYSNSFKRIKNFIIQILEIYRINNNNKILYKWSLKLPCKSGYSFTNKDLINLKKALNKTLLNKSEYLQNPFK